MQAESKTKKARNKDQTLVRATAALFEDIPGRLTIDCVMDIWNPTTRWSDITRSSFVNPTPANCAAGQALLAAVQGLPGLPASIAAQVHELNSYVARANADGNLPDCLAAGLDGRAAVWTYLVRPLSTH